MEDQVFITPNELKKLLHIGNTTLYKLLAMNGFPAFKLQNRWLINKGEMIEFFRKLSHTSSRRIDFDDE